MEAVAPGLDPALADRLGECLKGTGLTCLLILAESSLDPDLAPFVGPRHLGNSFVVVTPDGQPTLGFLTDMERDEARGTGLEVLDPEQLGVGALVAAGVSQAELWRGVLSQGFALLDIAPGRVALAGHLAAGTLVEACAALGAEGWAWQSGTELLRRWRKFKPTSWRQRLERPAAGVNAAMRAVAEQLAAATRAPEGLASGGEPLSIGRLRETVSREFSRFGLSQPEGNILAPGPAGGVPHSRGDSSHVLQPGEPLVVDLFPRGELFADCTRTFCVGEPPAGFAGAFSQVRRALEQAHAMCRPGIRGWDLQAATCDLFEAAGYETLRSNPSTRVGYVHGLGHGVGYELHEYPSFRELAGDEGGLEVGDLVTLEPGLYDAEAGYGIRLEDLCYLGPDGLQNLTPLPLEWDPALWV